jgi:tripartite-type tricarboxylate transporter receptor subunit TctC
LVNLLHKLVAIFVMAILCGSPASLWAQSAAKDYPNKPIRVIVPSPPGGPPDIIMRMIAPKLSIALGQPIVVDNRAGAGGIVGTAFVAKAAPDGYTWLVTTASHTNIPAFNPNVTYDPVHDFTPVTMIAKNFGQVLIVHPAVPAKTVQELIALAKREPGKLNYGSAGIGTASHIPAEVMKFTTGTDILGIQYKGVAEAIADLLGGRIDMFFVGTQLALSHVQAGRVRALAVTGPTRWKGMPDVPTMQQAGLKDFSLINWFGLWLPAGAPPEIVARLNAEVVKALGDADIKQQFDTLGLEGVGSRPDDFARFVAKDAAFTLEVARRIQAAAK